ncbi:MAG: hypothetical protein A3I88_03705 [Candidatus Portnoybacteria bacterium RIFCSPLOWO2_12_FULL_39_9]|uniref:HAD family hydrolase n=1 Tax=Candidatus Portnoybacteria bacterium RIFCSPHIGHO2_12_FULL_38_9 TaxID=1801997 RepID=A0A1G2FFY2_9BACT|nr:MAG: hypothetical protein A3H00_00125 [Candidatus Portnoybacteria bacterium RBG_13_40_8]OGZ35430.1 MAG: hypothetical protein A2646_03685 [Candidatus Portnoybacteria bacterium RIFCSPHIGHO2_02_FULL_39_12]OGZ36963.1 MAG: hypothetical protein A3J64_03755 [Candidatus Portnoybacteria bacterium RIFCSPHIGHO2_12_FULL_38_9]OGZ37953.1 MAG: hypothetical protein A3F21_02065 [Candidatus Portnoybacteria bacterium RIFCSPLOWO2_01_FULL_38_39]OGZ39976.1 MAG: hypothetical protein A3I88_03705 [Candidatus Portnoy
MKKIKGLIYDLDGTLISTQKLHETGWLYAGKKFNIPISKEMLLNQSGISNEEASLMMLPGNKKNLAKKFIKAKVEYVNKNLKRITLFPSALKTIQQLDKKGYAVWICTSAHKNFVKAIKALKIIKKIGNKIIWREMYKKGKPSPEALNLTMSKMGLANSQIYYIGDALNDYKTSVKAGVKFIYFCPSVNRKDLRIPKSVKVISSHKEILELLK